MHVLVVWYHALIAWYLASLASGRYVAVATLMAAESSVFPLPSELVIPPAVHLAVTRGVMSVPGIVLAGAVGSCVGASATYWAARIAGRPLLMRFGRYVLIPPRKIELAERWAARFGSFGVFASRLILVVRHLIGIPAGLVRIDFLKFLIYTFLGSVLWCTALAWVAIQAGQNKALMRGELKEVSLWCAGTLLFLGATYYFLVYRTTRNEKAK